jgi:WD40 repeat protein
MAFDPTNTAWSVAAMDNNGNLTSPFHPTPWFFLSGGAMTSVKFWSGIYTAVSGDTDKFSCKTKAVNGSTDSFEVTFFTPNNFIASKNGSVYRFGVKL